MVRLDNSWCVKGGTRGYVTVTDVPWPIGAKHSKHIETVPKGYEFESSVPSFLEWAFSPDDPFYLLAAAVHDWLIEQGYDLDFCDSQWFAAARKMQAPNLRTKVARFLMLMRRYKLCQ